jgi:hypothetical protein
LEQQKLMSERIVKMEMPVDEEGEGSATSIGELEGIEGQVWYFELEDGRAKQIKNKPPEILDYHWKAVGRDGKPKIPFHSLYITVVNSLENTDEPDFAFVKELLMEEYPEEMVDRARNKIEKTIRSVIFDRKITTEIIDEYKRVRSDVFNLTTARGPVMQKFAREFCDTEMDRKQLGTKIFNILVAYEEGLK